MKRYKYPKTSHLPWSDSFHKTDHRMIDPEIVFGGKEVVVTVKMDGENCLVGSTKIKLPNGEMTTLKKIVDHNMVGKNVLGYKDGKIVSSRILNVFDNGKSNESEWIEVSVRTPNGGPSRKVYCTEHHEWFTDRGWVQSCDLTVDDQVLYCKSQYGSNLDQRDILLGKVIGDGSIHIRYGNSALIQFSHKKEHREYLEYINQILGDITNGCVSEYTSGYGTEMLKTGTHCTHDLYDYFIDFIDGEGRKNIPEKVINDITPFSLMLWYLDDGSLVHSSSQRDRMQISVCRYNASSCSILQKCLEKYDIESTLHNYGGYNYLNINADNTEKFSELIASFIPDVMRYKLPESYRNRVFSSLASNLDCDYLHHEIWCSVDSVLRKPHRQDRRKYDIETETGNYFANGLLVHNCTMYPDYIHARSINSGWHESRSWVNRIQGEIGWQLKDNERICGENLYAEHSIHYKHLRGYFYVFGYWIGTECQSWDDTVKRAEELDLPVVDVIYRGIWDADAIKALIGTEFNGDEMEGYVVRPAGAFTHNFEQSDVKMPLGKYVRKDHVQTDQHWTKKVVVPNELG